MLSAQVNNLCINVYYILSVNRLPRLPSCDTSDRPTPSGGMYLDGRVGGWGASLGMTGPDVWGARGFGPALVVTGDLAGLGLMTAIKSGLGLRLYTSS